MNAEKLEKLKSYIDEIIKLAFERVQYAYDNNKEVEPTKNSEHKTRLVFPSYSNKKTRISEQELRFCFVEAFNEYVVKNEPTLYYSVETPTRDKYSGFSKKTPQRDDNGRSGEFDLVIFELEEGEMKRRCLIEFKANNADQKSHDKDFCKLNNENEYKEDVLLRYFIELINNYNDKTIENLKNKTKDKIGNATHFRCYSLENAEEISSKINQK